MPVDTVVPQSVVTVVPYTVVTVVPWLWYGCDDGYGTVVTIPIVTTVSYGYSVGFTCSLYYIYKIL